MTAVTGTGRSLVADDHQMHDLSETILPARWIGGLRPESPVREAAAIVLESRVNAVASMIDRIVDSSAGDDEAVHQLRVSTRRAQAALVSFKPWLRKRRRRALKKCLKQLRSAAGIVRTHDVHRALLARLMSDTLREDRQATEAMLLVLEIERRHAVRALLQVARHGVGKWLVSSAAKAVRKADHGPADSQQTPDQPLGVEFDTTVRMAGEMALAHMAAALVDAAHGDLSRRQHLHQVRLRGKALRYAIEIFGSTARQTSTLVGLADHLVSMQDKLGAVNDLHELAHSLAWHAAHLDALVDRAAAKGRLQARVPDESSSPASSSPSVMAMSIMRLSDHFEARCAEGAADFGAWWASSDCADFRALLQQLAAPASNLSNRLAPSMRQLGTPERDSGSSELAQSRLDAEARVPQVETDFVYPQRDGSGQSGIPNARQTT